MNILLIQPKSNYHHPWCETPSRALLILGTLAKQYGHKVIILHLDIERQNPKYLIRVFKPDIVGLTVNTFMVRSAQKMAKCFKAEGIQVVIGGPHAVAWDGEANVVVVGEGENRWLEILGEEPSIKSIDDIPIPDYSLINLARFTGVGPSLGAIPSMAIMASRGCPYQCSFCNTPAFWGKKVRYRAPELVVDEVEQLHRHYGINEIFFQDDTFNLNHKWATEIFGEIIRRQLNKSMVFRLTGRVNEKLVTDEYLKIAKRASIWNIFYGIESGSQYMLDRMKKGITIDEIKRAVKMTHKAGITTTCSFIVGLPGESWETLRQTNNLINEIQPSQFGWCYACPFPGTEFTKEVISSGHILHKRYDEYMYGMLVIRSEELSYSDLASFSGFNFIPRK